MKDDSAEILFKSFLQKALASSSGMGMDVHSSILSIYYFICRPRRRPPSKLMALQGRILISLAIAAFAEAVLMQTSAEQVPT